MGRYEIDFLVEYTDEALLAELRRIAALVPSGKRLTQATYEELSGRASRVTFLRRFGGSKQVLEKAGASHPRGGYPQLTARLTDSECFENLASSMDPLRTTAPISGDVFPSFNDTGKNLRDQMGNVAQST